MLYYILYTVATTSKVKDYDDASHPAESSEQQSTGESSRPNVCPPLDRDVSSEYLLEGEIFGVGHNIEHLSEYRKLKQV